MVVFQLELLKMDIIMVMISKLEEHHWSDQWLLAKLVISNIVTASHFSICSYIC